MNVSQITMPKDKAIEAYRAYRQAVNEGRANKEDEAIMMGYRAIAKGKAIINLFDAFRQTGLDDKERPKLAIARANWDRVRFERSWMGNGYRWAFSKPWNYGKSPSPIPLADGVLSIENTNLRLDAIVPIIPAPIRPSGDLSRYHILWEAEWRDVPRDPILLKKLSGSLYVVLAVWDLTEVERAVMGARLTT